VRQEWRSAGCGECGGELRFESQRDVLSESMNERRAADRRIKRTQRLRLKLRIHGSGVADLYWSARVVPLRHVAEAEFRVPGRPDELPCPQRANGREKHRDAAQVGRQDDGFRSGLRRCREVHRRVNCGDAKHHVQCVARIWIGDGLPDRPGRFCGIRLRDILLPMKQQDRLIALRGRYDGHISAYNRRADQNSRNRQYNCHTSHYTYPWTSAGVPYTWRFGPPTPSLI